MINCKHFICFSNKKTKFSEILYEISWLLHKFSVSLQSNYNKWARKSPFKQENKRKVLLEANDLLDGEMYQENKDFIDKYFQ